MQNEQQPPFLDQRELGELLGRASYVAEQAHAEPPVYDVALEQPGGEQAGGDGQGKKRKNRQTLPRGGACEFCKRRKLKCDGETPTCRACSKNKIECVYSQVKQRSRVRLLEDKLAELESRLTGGTPSSADTQAAIQHATGSSGDSYSSNPSTPYHFLPQYPASSLVERGSIPIDPALQGLGEPHLMTLANAAEAAGEPPRAKQQEGYKWEGLPIDTLLVEVLKAVDTAPSDTIGWAIINHAIDMHSNDVRERMQQLTLPLRTLLPRLAPGSIDRPHPALLLSIMFNYLPDSPSPSLVALSPRLLTPAQNAQEIGVANADRVIDLIRGGVLRTRRILSEGKYIQGWTEGGMTARLAFSAGLATINEGDIRQALSRSGGRVGSVPHADLERERAMRALKARTAIVENAVDEEDLKERIDLFWMIWMIEKLAEVCWGWRCYIHDEDVTTPWPRPHDEPLTTTHSGNCTELLRGQPRPAGAPDDTYLTASLKALLVVQRASALLDKPVGQESMDATRRLLLALTALDSSLPSDFTDLTILTAGATADQASKIRTLKLTLMSNMKIATALVHFKLDIDTPSSFHRDTALNALKQFTAGLDLIQDDDYLRFSILVGGPWFVIARSCVTYARYLERQPDTAQAVHALRAVAYRTIDLFERVAVHDLGSRPAAQVLKNALQGDDTLVGLTVRPDSAGRV